MAGVEVHPARRHRNSRHAYVDGLAAEFDGFCAIAFPLSVKRSKLLPSRLTRIMIAAAVHPRCSVNRYAKSGLLVAASFLIAQTVSAQEWSQPWARERIAKSPRHSEWASIKHDGRTV